MITDPRGRGVGRPAYRQLADLLRQRIEAGQYRPRQLLPSENHLQQEFGVARDTVRRALTILAEQGLTRTVAGRGTYVRQVDVTTLNLEPGMRIYARPATPAENDRLDCAWVLVIERSTSDIEVLSADSAELRVPDEAG